MFYDRRVTTDEVWECEENTTIDRHFDVYMYVLYNRYLPCMNCMHGVWDCIRSFSMLLTGLGLCWTGHGSISWRGFEWCYSGKSMMHDMHDYESLSVVHTLV